MARNDLQLFAEQEADLERQKQSLTQSASFAMDQNPSEYAELLKLSARTGVAPDLAKDYKPQLQKQTKMMDLSVDDIVRSNPLTAQFLANPDNMAVGQNDVGIFKTIEDTFKSIPAKFVQGYDKQRQMFLNYKEVIGQISPSEQAELARLEALAKERSQEYKEGLPSWTGAAADVIGMQAANVLDALKNEGTIGMGAGAATGATLGLVGGPGAPLTVTAGGAAGATKGLTVGTATGYGINMYESAVGEAYSDLKDFTMPDGTKLDPTVARYAAVIIGVPNTALETFALSKALKLIPGADKLIGQVTGDQMKKILAKPTMRAALADIGKKYAGAVAAETFTEGLQKFVNIVGREVAQEFSPGEFGTYTGEQFDEDVSAIIVESTEAFKASVVLGGLGGGVRVYKARQDVANAEQNQQIFEALGAAAEASETRKNVPEKFREFVEQATKDGPVENVFIEADRFNRFFQSVGVDPQQVAQELGISSQLDVATDMTDIVIPIGTFAEKLAGTQYLGGLTQDLRLRQGDLSIREAQIEMANQEARVAELEGQMDQLVAEQERQGGLDRAVERIVADVEGQLLGIGYDRQAATKTATVMRGIAVLAQRETMARAQQQGREATPEEIYEASSKLWEQYGLTVSRPLPEVLQRNPGSQDIKIDPLIDRLRAGDLPSDEAIFGTSLVEFIRQSGGIQVQPGELADADYDRRPFQRNLVQPQGMAIDDAAMRAVEAGYFPGVESGQLTESDILNALDEELRGGQITYAAQNLDYNLLQLRDQLMQLDDYLRQLDIDINAITDNAVVRQLIEQAAQQPEVQEVVGQLYQLAQSYFDQLQSGAQSEYDAVVAQYQGTEEWLRAPNGNRSNLSERQWVQVRTPSFKAWFGDWEALARAGRAVWQDETNSVSKVVDENGEPLVVYHGSDKGGFTEFFTPGGQNRGDLGIFTTSNYAMAQTYVKRGRAQTVDFGDVTQEDLESGREAGTEPGVYALFLNVREPDEANFEGANWNGRLDNPYFELKDADGEYIEQRVDTLAEAEQAVEDGVAASFEEVTDIGMTTDMVVRDANRYGNDGAIIRDVADDGGGSSPYAGEPSDVYVAFRPEQVKSADQNIGTFGADTRNILFQSDQTDTAGFQAWSKGHPVIQLDAGPVFKAGEPVVVEAIHGTTADVERFDRTKANIESDLGAGFYFSNTPDEIGANYAGLGPDLTNKIERLAEQLEQNLEYDPAMVDMDADQIRAEAQRRAREQFVANQGVSMPVYVRFDNPAVLGGDRETFLDYDEAFDPETEEYGEPTGALVRLMEAIREVEQNGEIEMDADAAIGALQEGGIDYNGMTASEAIEALKKALVYAVDYNTGDSATNEVVRQAFERAGFDGFIDQTVDKKFGSQRRQGQQMQGMNPDTVHFIAFNPNQIASRIGSTWDRGDVGDSILYQGLEQGGLSAAEAVNELGRMARRESPRTVDPRADRIYAAENYVQEIAVANPVAARALAAEMRANAEALSEASGLPPASIGKYARIIEDRLQRLQTYGQGQGMDENRGFIQFGRERKFNITLLEKANLSTFLHETGHFYLEVMGDLAEAEGASQQIRDDYAAILKYLGATSRADITLDGKAPGSAEHRRAVEMHEKFARSNEAYLMEGKAPSPELRSFFQTFKNWLKLIYKSMAELDVQLTDDVRAVFDRIYATDAEIEAARSEMDMSQLFLDANAAGMSEAEFAAYRESITQATESGKEALTAKLMREMVREQKAWWKDELTKVRAEVAAEVDNQQVYRTFKALVEGKIDDETPIKLNKKALVDKYGAEYVKRLPRSFARIYTTKGGMDADAAAEFLGYDSGDAMIEALVGMRPRNELIEAEAQQRMKERHGDMLMDGSIAEEARIALHNSQRQQVLAAELRALRRKQREVAPFLAAERQRQAADRRQARAAAEVPPAESFRAAARGIIGQTSVKDITPQRYLLAQRRHGRAAFEAMSKGDYQLAADNKQKEILNHYLYLEAVKAREDADKILKYAQKFEKGTTREKMGKAGSDYLEQIDAILDRYEFRRVPLSKMGRRASLAEWIAAQEAQGLEPSISAMLLNEARTVNYRQASIDELRAIYDAVRNIEHLARLKNKLVTKRAEIEFNDAIDELVASAENNARSQKPLPVDQNARTRLEKAGDTVSSLDSMLLKMEQIVLWLDGNKVDGPWHTFIWNPLTEAQTAEYDLTRELTEKLSDSLEKMPKAQRLAMLDTFEIPGIGKVTRKYLISVALNVGNQGNLEKMIRGMGWDMGTINAALSRLNDADWTFVEETWDTINSLWPQIAELEKRMTGIEPPKIEAQPYVVRDVEGNAVRTVKGGYYPLVYDPRRSEQGAKQETGNLGQLFEEGYIRATTPKGHTQARMEGFSAPLLFDFEQVVTQHMAKVVKDLTHREAVIAANKILTNKKIRTVLQETLGPAYEKQMLPWLRSVVNDRNGGSVQGLSDFSRWMLTMRANTVAAVMGFKATTMIAQFVGISQSLDLVKGRYLAGALQEFLRHPVATTRKVRELSGEMRNRSNTLDRDIRDQLRTMTGQTSKWAQAQRFAFHGIAIADAMVTVPTWMGAYKQALDAGADEATARIEADTAVRMTQGASGAKDLAAVQRNNELAKLVTMFYSYFNVLYNRMRDMGRDVQDIRDMPRFLARATFTVMIPAVFGEIILGRGPDDDEDPAAWAIRKVLLYPLMSIPVVRDVAGSLESGFDYRFSPAATVIEKIGKTAKDTGRLAEGDIEWGEYSARVAESLGYIFGVAGTAQIAATSKYLWRVNEGEEDPENLAELMFYAAMGKRKEQ